MASPQNEFEDEFLNFRHGKICSYNLAVDKREIFLSNESSNEELALVSS